MDINLTEINEGDNANVERFKGASWFETVKKMKIVVVGCGGIGSMTSFYLSRMQPNSIIIFDSDSVEGANLAGQLFNYKDIGKRKVLAVNDFCRNYSYYFFMHAITTNFTSDSSIDNSDIVISAVDNMQARKVIFDKWIKSDTKYLIDGRCNADVYQIFTLSKDNEYDIKRYQEEFLFSQEEADETVCSYKQTSFITGMIGSMISNIVASIANNMEEKNPQKIIPFILEYDSNIINLKTTV